MIAAEKVRAKAKMEYALKICPSLQTLEVCRSFLIQLKIENSRKSKSLRIYLEKFATSPTAWPAKYKHHKDFTRLANLYESKDQMRYQLIDKYKLMTRHRISLSRVIEAGFSHAGYIHLIGNLIILLAFGVFVEMALGSILTFLIFIFGSVAGMTFEALYVEPMINIVGASAGVSALIGAFYILFLRAKMTFLFIILLYCKRFQAAVLWAVPLIFILSDITGLISKESTNIAHFAHLCGLISGSLFTLVHKKTSQISPPFFFEEEIHYFHKYKSLNSAIDKIYALEKIYRINFQNHIAFNEALNLVSSESQNLQKKDYAFLNLWINVFLKNNLSNNDYKSFIKTLDASFEKLDFERVFKGIQWQTLLKAADIATRNNSLKAALTIYRYLIKVNPKGFPRESVTKTVENIEDLKENNNGVAS